MTSTIKAGMGSYHVTHGFVLNNQLTDFAATASTADGLVANRVQAGKRPRSSMAPTLVFALNPDGSTGALQMVTGSPGGGAIIQYVTKTLVGALDWGLNAQQASAMVNFGASKSGPDDPLVQGLKQLGHTVSMNAQPSGIASILRTQEGTQTFWQGGTDPRREGLALGDGCP